MHSNCTFLVIKWVTENCSAAFLSIFSPWGKLTWQGCIAVKLNLERSTEASVILTKFEQCSARERIGMCLSKGRNSDIQLRCWMSEFFWGVLEEENITPASWFPQCWWIVRICMVGTHRNEDNCYFCYIFKESNMVHAC